VGKADRGPPTGDRGKQTADSRPKAAEKHEIKFRLRLRLRKNDKWNGGTLRSWNNGILEWYNQL